ncbi:hypothetical protein ID871_34055 [Streptomyces pratensis]|nr:hypothetical protein [Streptomyces pratensis]
MLDYLLPSGDDLHEMVATSYEIEDDALPWEPECKDARAVFHRLKSMNSASPAPTLSTVAPGRRLPITHTYPRRPAPG